MRGLVVPKTQVQQGPVCATISSDSNFAQEIAGKARDACSLLMHAGRDAAVSDACIKDILTAEMCFDRSLSPK